MSGLYGIKRNRPLSSGNHATVARIIVIIIQKTFNQIEQSYLQKKKNEKTTGTFLLFYIPHGEKNTTTFSGHI